MGISTKDNDESVMMDTPLPSCYYRWAVYFFEVLCPENESPRNLAWNLNQIEAPFEITTVNGFLQYFSYYYYYHFYDLLSIERRIVHSFQGFLNED